MKEIEQIGANETQNEGLIKDTYEMIIKEIQTLITIAYLLMIGIGMLFKYKAYSVFGINIFEYADVFDFLIAPFQDIFIVLAASLAMIVPFVVISFDILFKNRFPNGYSKFNFGWDKKPWYNKLRGILFAFLIFYFIFEAASGYAGFAERVIYAKEEITLKYADNEIIQGKMIGKTNDVVFLYMKGGTVKAIPIPSLVKEIEIRKATTTPNSKPSKPASDLPHDSEIRTDTLPAKSPSSNGD